MAEQKGNGFTIADAVTLAGYGLGLWWASGGPGWAALASMACDELDEPLARRVGGFGPTEQALDWGANLALTPLALVRLSRDLGHPSLATVGAPIVLAAQARAKARGIDPPIGSARAVIMAAGLIVEHQKRANPSRERRRRKRG